MGAVNADSHQYLGSQGFSSRQDIRHEQAWGGSQRCQGLCWRMNISRSVLMIVFRDGRPGRCQEESQWAVRRQQVQLRARQWQGRYRANQGQLEEEGRPLQVSGCTLGRRRLPTEGNTRKNHEFGGISLISDLPCVKNENYVVKKRTFGGCSQLDEVIPKTRTLESLSLQTVKVTSLWRSERQWKPVNMSLCVSRYFEFNLFENYSVWSWNSNCSSQWLFLLSLPSRDSCIVMGRKKPD